MKVYMQPKSMNLGIGRVVRAYTELLPNFDFEFVDKEDSADIVVLHAGEQATRYPDVAHNHGLYPTAAILKDRQFFSYNAKVIDNLRRARIVTVPSEWVADQLRRDMLIDPIVLPHGIYLDEWKPFEEDTGYVVWAKGHVDRVCDPVHVNEVAKRMSNQHFITTFGTKAANVKVTGALHYDKMPELLGHASVYLSTTRETFGVQLLEAMALGVPIVGWNNGAIGDIVMHGETGFLCEPGDYDGLVRGIEWCKRNRKKLRKNCLDVVKRYSWDTVIGELAEIYHDSSIADVFPFDVTVVMTCYNRSWCIGNAINSVLQQEFDGSVEIIVVNDASTDNSVDVIKRFGNNVRLINLKTNVGAAMARNIGIQYAKSDIIASLDSDDIYYKDHLATLVPVVKSSRDVGIAYGGLTVRSPRGEYIAPWTRPFDYMQQLGKHNHVPSASVFRKDAWKRVRGYTSSYIRGEDSRFWLDIATVGYKAVYIDKPVYICNIHQESLTMQNEEPDWVADIPWALDADLTPFAAPTGSYTESSFPVYEYDMPWVSVIIPVGPRHANVVWRAVDSVWKQSLKYWECIVVNDSGEPMIVPQTGQLLEEAYPFITVLETDGGQGPGYARNLGVEYAKASLVTFLDADDILLMYYLQQTVDAYNYNPDCYVYTNWFTNTGEHLAAPGYDPVKLLREALHPVTLLVPKKWHLEIGGFDEELKGWEDWDYVLNLAKYGHGGSHLEEALMVYDYTQGDRRDSSLAMKEELLETIRSRYKKEDVMGCLGCKKTPRRGLKTPRVKPVMISKNTGRGSKVEDRGNMVRVRENSGNLGRHSVKGRSTRANYGMRKHGDEFDMYLEDQRMMPHVYTIVEQRGSVTAALPQIPQVPVVEDVILPDIVDSVPTTIIAGEDIVVEDDGSAVVEVTPGMVVDVQLGEPAPRGDDEFELDISILPLDAIRRLDVDSETAFVLLEEELYGRNRKTVVDHLKREAKSYMDVEGIDFEELLEGM